MAHGDRPTLSIDSEQIAEVAREMGLTVPRLRDWQLDEDEASAISTLWDAASWQPSREAGPNPVFAPLELSSPVGSFSLLPRAVSPLQQPGADNVLSAVKAMDPSTATRSNR